MSDTSQEIPIDSVIGIDTSTTLPPQMNNVVDDNSMSGLLAKANSMSRSGVPTDQIDKFLQDSVSKFPTYTGTKVSNASIDQEIPIDGITAFQGVSDPFKGSSASADNDYLSLLKDLPLGPASIGTYAQGGQDIKNSLLGVGSYFKNYSQEHETVEPGVVTPDEKEAAKIMGMSLLPDGSNSSFIMRKNPDTGKFDLYHPPIYKMSPEDRQALDDKTVASMGGVNNTSQDFDPTANILQHNSILNWASDQFNPEMEATRRYEKLQNTTKALDILKNPSDYSNVEVQKAQQLVDFYKKTTGQSLSDNIKSTIQEIKDHPGDTANNLVQQLLADPELMGLGEVRVGKLLMNAKEAALAADLNKAQFSADLAKKIQGADVTGKFAPGSSEAAATLQDKVDEINSALKSTRQKKSLINAATDPALGAVTNVALSNEQQLHDQGYVTKGSQLSPAFQGAVLGAIGSGAELGGLPFVKGEIHPDEITPVSTGADYQDRPPGKPLPPDTPINKSNHVPYYGGVGADGNIIHIDKNTPNTLLMNTMSGNTVQVPVLKTVAYHERVEAPLMHLSGPMSREDVQTLINNTRGEGTIPISSIKKLLKGESLYYPEAHEIATLAENRMVRSLYGVDPKVYQEALKPYIKQVAKDNKTTPPSDIPNNLDTKPYEDMGGEESLKGKGETPSIDSIPVDKKQSGGINKTLIATGVASGIGAGVGAYLDPDKKKGILEGAFVPILSRVASHGDAIDLGGNLRELRKSGEFGDITSKGTVKKLEDLKNSGMSPREIWKQTGAYHDPNGNWYKELPDESMTILSHKELLEHPEFKKKGYNAVIPISDYVKDSPIEKEYPTLWKELKVQVHPDSEMGSHGAWYDSDSHIIHTYSPENLPNYGRTGVGVMKHELQHAINDYEGLPRGSSPGEVLDHLNNIKDTYKSILAQNKFKALKYQNAGNTVPAPILSTIARYTELLRRFPDTEEGMRGFAYDQYTKVIGETQANTVALRGNFTPEQRANIYPGTQIHTAHQQWDINTPSQLMKDEIIPDTGELPKEREIIEKAKNGNVDAINTLYSHYMPKLTSFLKAHMRNAGAKLGLGSEDLAQEAFLKALQNLHTFKGDSKFKTWLFTIGKNESLNAIAKEGREVPTESMFRKSPEGEEFTQPLSGHVGFGKDTSGESLNPTASAVGDEGDTPESLNSGHQISNLVRQTIATLPKQYAKVLTLKELDGLTDVEVARTLGMPVGTVNTYAMRGRQYLARAFEGTPTAKLFKQTGSADPELLKRLAKFTVLAGVGAAAGANLLDPKHPYRNLVQGTVLGLLAGRVKWSSLYDTFKDSMKYDPKVSIRGQLNQYDWDLARNDRLVVTTQDTISKLAPTIESRNRISNYLDGDTSIKLTPKEQKAANFARGVYDKIGQEALQSGVLQNFLDNYVNHEWKPTPKREQLLKEMQEALEKQPNMSPNDRHALTRKFTSIAAGKAAGLEPVSEDANVLLKTYMDSMAKSMANRKLLQSLKTTKIGEGKATMIMPAGKAPSGYVPMRHSALAPYRVHPSIAPSLNFLYHTTGGLALVQAVEGLNTAIKRMDVSFSLFHAKSLIDAALSASEFGHPIRTLVDIAQSTAGKDRGHEAYLKGDVGDDIDHLLRSLKITPKKGAVSVEDVTTGFYNALNTLQSTLDSIVPKSGTLVTPLIGVSHDLDKLLWENVHSGLKLVTAMNVLERLRRSYAKDFESGKITEIPSTSELADRAGSFVNDTFGGLNWRRIADDATTKWGHAIANTLASPSGRRLAQILMFAPDWTYSTVRSVIKAFGPGSGLKGLLNPKEIADLHRQYIIRSAVIYATLYNGINIAMSGHPIWENKRNGKPEPFLLDLGNGEWAQANKHAMEVPNLLTHPGKWISGKLGILPSEALDQIYNKEYLSPDYSPPMKEGRIAHAMNRVLPFSYSSYLTQGPKEAISSALGVPIYGHVKASTYAEKQADRERNRETRAAAKKKRDQQRLDSLLRSEQ